jgi:hypothetical protein
VLVSQRIEDEAGCSAHRSCGTMDSESCYYGKSHTLPTNRKNQASKPTRGTFVSIRGYRRHAPPSPGRAKQSASVQLGRQRSLALLSQRRNLIA